MCWCHPAFARAAPLAVVMLASAKMSHVACTLCILRLVLGGVGLAD